MYPFDYLRPTSIADAENILANDDDARMIAGGQSLLPMMKQRLVMPSCLVDIRSIQSLAGVSMRNGKLHIGAMTRHIDVATSSDLGAPFAALNILAAGIGDVQVRHRGTIGGSVSNNDPAADYPAACLALDATIVTSKREIAAGDFFAGMFETALGPGEIVTGVAFTRPERACYLKFRHQISRYALVGVFVAVLPDEVRVSVTGAASNVFRVSDFEAALSEKLTPGSIAGIDIHEADLNDDIHASAAYRAHMIRHLAMQAVASLS